MLDQNILESFFESVNSRDIKQMGGLFTEDSEIYFPKTQPLIGRERIVRFFKILFRQYPELSFQIQRSIIEGNRAAVQWKNRGKNRRGEGYENEGVTIFEENNGLIDFMSDFFKDTEKF